jgi:hypothetical protein
LRLFPSISGDYSGLLSQAKQISRQGLNLIVRQLQIWHPFKVVDFSMCGLQERLYWFRIGCASLSD